MNVPGTKQTITFVDTPGHAAFASMRARGARATDIAGIHMKAWFRIQFLLVIVVAIDDGVQEQTVEVLNAVREANIPLIVAINKCDKKGFTQDTVKQQLRQNNLHLEEDGGDIHVVPISALKRQNLDELLSTILLQVYFISF